MNYYDMVRNAPNKSEEIMWQSVRAISELLDKHPEIARAFLINQYKAMYGEHFNETMARDAVHKMYHHDGSNDVRGEIITPDDAMLLVSDKDNPEKWRWDAYVAANSFAHDIAGEGLAIKHLLMLAKRYWFCDVDFTGHNKIFWYYSNID